MSEDRGHFNYKGPQDLLAWLHRRAQAQGKANNEVLTEILQAARDADTSTPGGEKERERRRITSELVDVIQRLKKLRFDPKLTRLRTIAGFLVLDPAKHDKDDSSASIPFGPYLALNKDWNRIRLQAAKDFKQGASWLGSLKSFKGITIESAIEIDQACDLADEIDKLKALESELSGKLDLLRQAVADAATVPANNAVPSSPGGEQEA
jgi:hypothetical protein